MLARSRLIPRHVPRVVHRTHMVRTVQAVQPFKPMITQRGYAVWPFNKKDELKSLDVTPANHDELMKKITEQGDMDAMKNKLLLLLNSNNANVLESKKLQSDLITQQQDNMSLQVRIRELQNNIIRLEQSDKKYFYRQLMLVFIILAQICAAYMYFNYDTHKLQKILESHRSEKIEI
jgi:hypothetical protein